MCTRLHCRSTDPRDNNGIECSCSDDEKRPSMLVLFLIGNKSVSLLHSLSDEDKDFLTLCLLHVTTTGTATIMDSNKMQPRMGRSNANTMFSANNKSKPCVLCLNEYCGYHLVCNVQKMNVTKMQGLFKLDVDRLSSLRGQIFWSNLLFFS